METKIYRMKENINKEEIEISAKEIKKGNLVVFPTETVYGVGADGLNSKAVEKIFKAKDRPSDNPLILHIESIDMLEKLVNEIPNIGRTLIKAFWPGSLTLLFKKNNCVPDIVTAGLNTVAIRMPKNNIAINLLRESETPIAAPSANISGRPSPTKAEHVERDLDGKVSVIIDGGMTDIGIESTVLDISEEVPIILRPGSVTKEEIEKVLGIEVEYDKSLICEKETPKSPGQKYRHYAPNGEMQIFIGSNKSKYKSIIELYNKYKNDGKKVGVLVTAELAELLSIKDIVILGSRNNLLEISSNLFDKLREFDKLKVDIILSEGIEEEGIGVGIMNRMKKAAGNKVNLV